MLQAGRAEVAYAIAPPVAGWFQILLEIPAVEGAPKSVERSFAGSDAPAVRVALEPGLVDLGTGWRGPGVVQAAGFVHGQQGARL
jgi:hypothetical protein